MSVETLMGVLAFLDLMARQQEGPPPPGQPGQPGPPGPPGPPAPPPDPGQPIPPPGVMPPMPPPGVMPTPPPAPPVPPGPSPMPPMPPWPPPPVPTGLPPFPGPGWVPDTPVTPAISARATYWLPILWDTPSRTIRQAYAQEQFGGQWVTFAAAWHPGDKGPQTYMAVEAWRLAGAPPVAPPVPTPPPPVVPPPAPPGPTPPGPPMAPAQATALAMNNALAAHGYKQRDQSVYKAFQLAAKLGADGFPGQGTMAALGRTLQAMGVPIAPVKVYPWKTKPGTTGYDGVNAPTLAEWLGVAPPAPPPPPYVPPVPPPPAPPAPPSPGRPPATPAEVAAVAMNNALAAHGYKQSDQPLYKSFQSAIGTGADGFPGTGTMGHLHDVLAGMGVPMAPVTVYAWHSKPGLTGYDGINAPTLAEWQG